MKKSRQHTIDFLFPIALFFVFASTALLVLLLAANIYQNIVKDSDSSFTQTTALTYISEKIHQNDSGGADSIYLSKFDGCDALTLVQKYGEETYFTYIYEYNGKLMELFIQSDVEATASSGSSILRLDSLEMKELSHGVYQFTCVSEDGSSDSTIISLRSNQ